MRPKSAVLLVGHGAFPSDCPRGLVAEYKKLESERQARGGAPSPREEELDAQIRRWPRSKRTDPYKYGVEAIASALRRELPRTHIATAYNEFCAPGIEEAVRRLASQAITEATVITTMYTRGGLHSEIEIPQILKKLRREHPRLKLRYAWPFPLKSLAAFLAAQVRASSK